MTVGSASLRRRAARLALLLALGPAACGDPPAAPPPAPEAFDDPFTDAASAPPDRPAARADADAAAASVTSAARAPSATHAADPDGTAAPDPAVATLDPAVAAAGPGRPGDPTPGGPPTPSARRAAPRASGPVPADSPAPAPVPKASPAPAPVPKDSPAPAPVPKDSPAPAPVEAPAPPPAPPQQRFAGTFKFVGGEAQRTALAAAIEAAVQELNALIRGIGRRRLGESNVVREQITIAVDGDRVTTTFAPGRTIAGTLAGPAVPWTSDAGKPLRVQFSLHKGRLVQTFTAEDGGRRNVFTLDEAGDRMTLSVTITSERLTNPIKYALSYRRG